MSFFNFRDIAFLSIKNVDIAGSYIASVEMADGEPLESVIREAMELLINNSIANNNLPVLSRSLLLCGPRTLQGAMNFIRGGSAINYGFNDLNYNRLQLQGNGINYLDMLQPATSTDLNSYHQAIWVRTPPQVQPMTNQVEIGYSTSQNPGGSWIGVSGSSRLWRNRNNATGSTIANIAATEVGFLSTNRTNPDNFVRRRGNGVEATISAVSQVIDIEFGVAPTYAFARGVEDSENGDFPSGISTSGLSWISCGEAIGNPAALANDLATYINTVETFLNG